jgi:hypothetical protein
VAGKAPDRSRQDDRGVRPGGMEGKPGSVESSPGYWYWINDEWDDSQDEGPDDVED